MLRIVIVGAGIAGLTAAISLRRAGHAVDVYERSSMNNEVGAAINVPPNATRFLIPWGLDPKRWLFVTPRKVTYHDPFTLETKMQILNGETAARVGGSELYFAHRVDLHNALKWMATRPDGPGRAAVVHLGSRVVAYDPLAPSITLASGRVIHGDVVIGADGVHSIAPEAVVGAKAEPVAPGHQNSCYRFLIPAATLEEDAETRFFNEDREGWCRIFPHNDTFRRMVVYPCRNNTIHNFVGIFYDPEVNATHEDWQARVGIEDVLERFSDFDPKFLKIIRKATEAKQWPLLYRHPIPRWHRGRMALAGDAAHPMLPHHAQGGAQGMEDGLTLGIVLHGATTPDEIEKRLEIYDKVRRRRASVIQILSNVGQDQTSLVREELRPYLTEEQFPKNQRETMRHNYGFDVVRATLDAMTEHDPSFELPADFFEGEVKGVPVL